ncbi:hypothetical protein [Occallatibacter savannae]|uniref:hypothetical protein n=1 Tax=Occallatibacter savannae TaxID=1002691 RepID=UPI000D685B90|nr:hypothetical protein [Occallatibacter savannae]
MTKPFALAFSAIVLILAPTLPSFAQQQLAMADLPAAPEPEPAALILPHPPAAPKTGPHGKLPLNKASVAFLFASEAFDSWTTYNNLTHPKWICGYSAAFGNAVTYISDDGKRYDPHTIQYSLCGPGPSGQLANYAYDVTRTGAYTETGWVSAFRLAGARNAAGAIAWNVADDFGQMLVAHYLAKRSRFIRSIAPGINIARGSIHLGCGIQNLQFARHHSSAGAWNLNLPDEANLYPAPRWWGRL